MNEKQLLDLKKTIDETKDEVKQLEGRQKYLMQQLKKEWKCSNLEQAKKKLEKMKKDVADIDEKIKEGVAVLEEKYELG